MIGMKYNRCLQFEWFALKKSVIKIKDNPANKEKRGGGQEKIIHSKIFTGKKYTSGKQAGKPNLRIRRNSMMEYIRYKLFLLWGHFKLFWLSSISWFISNWLCLIVFRESLLCFLFLHCHQVQLAHPE